MKPAPRRAPRVLPLGCLLLLSVCAVSGSAEGVGLSLSTDTFVSFSRSSDPAVPPGLYGGAGLTWLPGDHLELELYHVPQLTPSFYSQVFFGASGGWWLLERKRTGYFNVVVSGGLLYGLDNTKLLALRISPFVLGGPDYTYSERLLTFGLLFDPERLQFLLELRLLAVTVFF
jgi:hypothetical protein